MSRCNISIDFDKPDRVYQPGETISGEISIQVTKDTQCSGLIVEQFWQTHGRGNTDRGDLHTVILDEGMWQEGDHYRFPFTFATPNGPPTYRGKYLNIDHYIEVRVDVPWAFDPTHREEFILLPGDRPYAHAPEINETSNTSSSLAKWAGVPFLIIAGILIVTPLFFIGIPLMIGALFFIMRNFMAEKRIGKVDVHWDNLAAVPGEPLGLNINFVPIVTGKLNAITAVLRGVESVESGSGTKRTTHTHVLEERTVTLYSEGGVTAGVPIDLNCEIPIPQTDAFTFIASDNKIMWTVTLRIDIPMWPDWVVVQLVQVRPYKSEGYGQDTDVSGHPDKFEAAGIPPEKKLFSPPPGANGGLDSSPKTDENPIDCPKESKPEIVKSLGNAIQRASKPAKNVSPIVSLLRELSDSTGFATDRDRILAKYATQSLVVTVEVERIERTFGYGKDERYRDGRTIIGKVSGTDFEVSVQCLEMRNEELDKLSEGDSISIKCVATDWDSLYRRLELNEA